MRYAIAIALVGCTAFDPGQPIQLVADAAWSKHDRAALAAASECWNLRFGTRFEVVDTPSEPQVVLFDYDPLACWESWGRYLPGNPGHDSVCPIPDLVRLHPDGVFFDPGSFLFRIVEHELGHALNIPNVESSNLGVQQQSVMGGNLAALTAHLLRDRAPGEPAFTDFDARVFAAANPGFVPIPVCDDVGLVYDDTSELTCVCPDQ